MADQRVWALALLLLTAGCVGADDAGITDNQLDDGATDATRPPLPENIEASEMIVGGRDPFNAVDGEPCTTEASQCTRYPFTLETDAVLDAALTWTIDANDFDLYVYDGDRQKAMSAGGPPSTAEGFSVTLGPGDYEIIVVAWLVTQDTYTLTGTFEYA